MLECLINKPELLFLLKHLSDDEVADCLHTAIESGEILAKGRYPTGRYKVLLSEGQAERVLDLLGDLLSTIGISSDGELNPVGYQIEGLIDIFQCAGESSNPHPSDVPTEKAPVRG